MEISFKQERSCNTFFGIVVSLPLFGVVGPYGWKDIIVFKDIALLFDVREKVKVPVTFIAISNGLFSDFAVFFFFKMFVVLCVFFRVVFSNKFDVLRKSIKIRIILK